MDDKQFYIKNETLKVIKKLGKRKPAAIKQRQYKVGGVSSQFFAETEVLSKNFTGSQCLNLRETLSNLCES